MSQPERPCVAHVVATDGPCGADAPNHQLTVGGSEAAEQVLPICDEHYRALAESMQHGERYSFG
jgi:hypothetical protein